MRQQLSLVLKALSSIQGALRFGILAIILSSAPLFASASAAHAQSTSPEGQAYQVVIGNTQYSVRLSPGGRYADSRPRTGRWQYDGRTLCMLVDAAGPDQPEYEVCGPWRSLEVGESYTSRFWSPDGANARVTRLQ